MSSLNNNIARSRKISSNVTNAKEVARCEILVLWVGKFGVTNGKKVFRYNYIGDEVQQINFESKEIRFHQQRIAWGAYSFSLLNIGMK